jgi:hypothetical protein
MVTEFTMRMQDGLPAPGASIKKSGSTQDTVMVAFENMREVAACRAKPILVFLLAFSHHVYLGESLRTQVYNIASENPRVGQESWGDKGGRRQQNGSGWEGVALQHTKPCASQE